MNSRRRTGPNARAPYTCELAEIPTTYARLRSADVEELRRVMLRLAAGPARMVGTGGTFPLAILAAQLHETISRQPARAVTPLALLRGPELQAAGAMLFSARVGHIDARLALEHLAMGGYDPAILLTHRAVAEINVGADSNLDVVQVPAPALPEGFLATNSVLAMSVALIRAGLGDVLGERALGDPVLLAAAVEVRERLLVLHAPSLAPVAADLETRFSELGLAAVQVSDLRNVAHGRHAGLARRAPSTSIVVLADEQHAEIADAVSAPLARSGAAVAVWRAEGHWAEAVVSLLAGSMHLTQRFAAAEGVEPSRPGVPSFGRRLYNLPMRRLLAGPPRGPVQRKLAAVGAGDALPLALTERYEAAFAEWSADLRKTRISAIAIDYDGTTAATTRRFDPPAPRVQESLLRALDEGLAVGFASGRGKSLHEGLRRWVPKRLWPRVVLGLYNGAVRVHLSEDLEDITVPTPLMCDVVARLESAPFVDLVELTPRSGQVGVSSAVGGFFHAGRLAALVRDIVARPPALEVKVVASGHSVDVIADDTSKVLVLEDLEHAHGNVLSFGDQGDVGGNDFELLAARAASVSVDRCSVDPTRCWYVDPVGRRGPAALAAALDALAIDDGAAVLDVRRISRRRTRSA